MSLQLNVPPSLTVNGPRRVLTQVFYNLLINSIDAGRSRKRPRPMQVFIHAHAEASKVVIQFWDDGPGINRVTFPNPGDIFIIGRTTKPNGTGTGLCIARLWLGRYFDGDLQLDEPETARFRVELPTKPL